MFQDVTTLMLNPAAFKDTIDLFNERYKTMNVEAVAGAHRLASLKHACAGFWQLCDDGCAGFEARGLIFGAPLALLLGVPFIPLRKPKKLPGAPRGHLRCLRTNRIAAERVSTARRERPSQPNPGEVISEEYALEYGTDRLEMHVGAIQPGQRVVLVRRAALVSSAPLLLRP